MNYKALLSLITVSTIGAGVLAVVAVLLSNPERLGPILVTVWFLLAWVTIAGALAILLYVAKSQFRREDTGIARVRGSLRQGALVGGCLVIMLALSSLRQLGLRDGILIATLAIIIEFYARTRA